MTKKKEKEWKAEIAAADDLEKVAEGYEKRGKLKRAVEFYRDADRLRKKAGINEENKWLKLEKAAAGVTIAGIVGGFVQFYLEKFMEVRFSPGGLGVGGGNMIGTFLILAGVSAGICWFLIRRKRKSIRNRR